SSSLDQEDSDPPPIKEEQEEPWCHQDREQLTVKQESDASLVTHIHKEDDQSDEKSEMDTTVGSSVSPELDCDQQLLSNSPHVAESKDQENDNNKESESTADEELKPTVKQNKRKRHRGNANNPADSAVDCDTHIGATSATFTTAEKVEQFESDLTGHWRIQTSDNQAGCEVTPSAKSESDEHIKIYTFQKPHLCKTCGKSFRYSSALTSHKRVHSSQRPYVCKTCGKSFRYDSNLTSHMRVHTGEKPYSCRTCGKMFSCSSALSTSEFTQVRNHICVKLVGKLSGKISH
ncbi:unnamed protein product, partial [Tetraodon nigroviridis]